MKRQSGNFEGRELKNLFYQCWLPDSNVKAYIVAIHDLATDSDRFEMSAEYLTENGYAVYSFDLRGHRRNTGGFPGNIDSMDHIQKDIILFMDLIRKLAEDKKIFLMGHSLGGLISIIYAIDHPGLPGVVVSSPSLGLFLESMVDKKVAKKLAGSIAKLAPNKLIKISIDQKQLTSDLKILRKQIADKNKLNTITVKTLAEINNAMKWAIDNVSNLTCPLLIQQAGNDKLVDKEKNINFFNNVKSQDKTYKEYDGFLHDLWNEKGRAQVFQDLYIWLEKHL
ncbi:MAG: alpha/beta hydrolase [Candidatus Thorarchaeota archaeon]